VKLLLLLCRSSRGLENIQMLCWETHVLIEYSSSTLFFRTKSFRSRFNRQALCFTLLLICWLPAALPFQMRNALCMQMRSSEQKLLFPGGKWNISLRLLNMYETSCNKLIGSIKPFSFSCLSQFCRQANDMQPRLSSAFPWKAEPFVIITVVTGRDRIVGWRISMLAYTDAEYERNRAAVWYFD
jgi:hypothetical protein